MCPARRKWGQHWLASQELADSLVARVSPQAGDQFLEIGPGQGRMTRSLLRHPVTVVAVEIDPRGVALLDRIDVANLRVVHADILAHRSLPWVSGAVRLIGNLPYNVSSPILRLTADHHERVIDAHYMLQEEVAERVASPPGQRRYGLLSVLLQWHFDCAVVKRLDTAAFRPPPKVRSAFVRLRPRTRPPAHPMDTHCRSVLEAAFGHRRKTLARALRHAGWSSGVIETARRASGIDGTRRAEQLWPEEFGQLADALPRASIDPSS